MTNIRILAMPTDEARAFQSGTLDANGQPPEHHKSTGPGNPCRHCLETIEEGADKLVLAYRPFKEAQPYAELGPIFLHGKNCERYAEDAGMPEMFKRWGYVLVRGYGTDDRIQYKTARQVPIEEFEKQCEEMLQEDGVSYLHVRTPLFNCYECRVERA